MVYLYQYFSEASYIIIVEETIFADIGLLVSHGKNLKIERGARKLNLRFLDAMTCIGLVFCYNVISNHEI